MSGAKTSNGVLRNQLLSNDIGQIDVRDEDTIAQQQYYQQHRQQLHYQQQQQNITGLPPQQHQHQYQQYPPVPVRQPLPYQQQHQQSRKSSLTSSSGRSLFNKMTKKTKSFTNGGSGDEDDDDDGKDVILESSQANSMTFEDISTIKDRGRYGGGSSFDTTPIIPTLQTSGATSKNMTSAQYRKQMNNFKKQAYSNAGKLNQGPTPMDPRAMSLQSAPSNSYQRQQQFFPQQFPPQQVSGPALGGPRANSLMSGARPPYNGQAPVQRGPPFPQYPPQNPNQHPPFARGQFPSRGPDGPGPRAMSLQTGSNMYQQQQRQPFRSNLGPPGPRGLFHGVPSPHPLHEHPQQAAPPSQRLSISNQGSSSQATQHQQSVRVNGTPVHLQQQPNTSQAPKNTLRLPESQLAPQNVSTVSDKAEEEQEYDGTPIAESSHHYLAENTINDSFNSGTFGEDDSNGSVLVHQKIKEDVPISPSKLPRSKGLPHLSLLNLRDDDDDDDGDGEGRVEAVNEIKKEEVHQDLLQNDDEKAENEDEVTTDEDIAATYPNNNIENSEERNEHFSRQRLSQQYIRSLNPVKETERTLQYPTALTPPLTNSSSASPNNRSSFSPLNSGARTNPSGKHTKNAVSISSMSEYSTYSGISDTNQINQTQLLQQQKLYHLSNQTNATANTDMFVTASQFSLLGSNPQNGQLSCFNNPQEKPIPGTGDEITFDTLHETTFDTLNRTQRSHGDIQTPIIQTSEQFDDSTPVLHERSVRNSFIQQPEKPQNKRHSITNDDSASLKSAISTSSKSFKLLKSPKFFSNWKARRTSRKEQQSATSPENSRSENRLSQDLQSTNSVAVSEPPQRKEFHGPSLKDSLSTGVDSYISPGLNIGFESNSDEPRTLDPSRQPSASIESLSPPAVLLAVADKSKGSNEFAPATEPIKATEESFPIDEHSRSSIKKLDFTAEQLGIMQDKLDIINELELVSNELVQSVKREIQLEERLKILSAEGENGNTVIEDSKSRDQSVTIANLVKSLNEERRTRYIAEEHVMLYENGMTPSPLELNCEISALKSSNLVKDDLINKQNSEITNIKHDLGIRISELKLENETLIREIIPNLKSQIQFLTKDTNNVSILTERLKIANNEKAALQKALQSLNYQIDETITNNDSASNFTFVSNEKPESLNENFSNDNANSPDKSIKSMRSVDFKLSNGGAISSQNTHKNSGRLASFSLINVGTSEG